MKTIDETLYENLADAYAFFGNSFLSPMTRIPPIGLEPAFWKEFPSFGCDEIDRARSACAEKAAEIALFHGKDAPHRTAVEFTRLFVGPNAPAAAPWESFYTDGAESHVGFGTPAFEMRALLRDAGLEVSNENNQYPDHIGIELLYLSTLCSHAAETARLYQSGEGEDVPAERNALELISSFLSSRLLRWTPKFEEKILQDAPDGYYLPLTVLLLSVLRFHETALREA